MKQSIARRGAAIVTAAALTLGASALLAPAADAKPKPKPLKGSTTGTVLFNCEFAGTAFEYPATIKLSGTRASKTAKPVKLVATMSDLPGVAPLALNFDATSAMDVTVGTVDTVLKGKGKLVTEGPREPAKMFPAKGAVNTRSNSLPVTVAAFEAVVFGNAIPCVPAEGQGALGTLTLK